MSIQEISSNFKHFLGKGDMSLTFLIVAVAVCSFFLGRASYSPQITPSQVISTETPHGASVIQTREAESIEGERQFSKTSETSQTNSGAASEGGYVASKSGEKYHLPWCSGAKRIKEENKIWFKTKAEAEAAGYEPASNCKGI
jgi:Metal binding domain of Ada